MRRSSRPRAHVDYTVTTSTAKTPGWLKKGKDAGSDDSGSNEEPAKENRKPQRATAQEKGLKKASHAALLETDRSRPQVKEVTKKENGAKQQARRPLQESTNANISQKQANGEKAANNEQDIGKKIAQNPQDEKNLTVPEGKGKENAKAKNPSKSDRGKVSKASAKPGAGNKGQKAASRPSQPQEADTKQVEDPMSTITTRTRSHKRLAEDSEPVTDSDARTSKRIRKGKAETEETIPKAKTNSKKAEQKPSEANKSNKNKAPRPDAADPDEQQELASTQPEDSSNKRPNDRRMSKRLQRKAAPANSKEKGPQAEGNISQKHPAEQADADAGMPAIAEKPVVEIAGQEAAENQVTETSSQGNHSSHQQPDATQPQENSSATFLELQAEYSALQQKYEEIKASHISDVESVITEVRAQEQAHTKKALQLAAHWEAEAQRQAAIAQAGDVGHLQHQIEGLDQELTHLHAALIDREAEVLGKDEEILELQDRLTTLIRLVETYQETLPDSLPEGVEWDTGPAATPASHDTGRSVKLKQLRGILGGAKQSHGHLARTPAAHLRPSHAASVVGTAQQQQDSRSHSKLPPPTNRGAQNDSSHTAGLTPKRTSSPLVPYSVRTQAGHSAAKSQGTAPKGPPVPVQKQLGLDYTTAAVTPNQTEHDNLDLPQPAVQRNPLQSLDVASKSVNPASAQNPTAQKAGLLSVYQSTVAGSWSTPRDKECQISGRQLAFTHTSQPGTANQDTPAEARMFGEEQTVHGPEFQKLAEIANQTAAQHAPSGLQGVEQEDEEPQHEAVAMIPKDSQDHHSALDTSSLGALSDVTNKGLMNLVGLTINAAQKRGGFSYSHPPTGFVFEIRKDESDSEEEEPCLIFNPLDFGSAATLLPPYLKYEIKFAPEMRLKLVSRIMSHLGQTALIDA